ncbi:MAG: RdgB/HAM1 family non-canonical purine NTP pyrophosphatase [Actinomycetes bacterium]
MRQVVLATRNKGKIAEFERLLAEYASDIEVLGLQDFPDLPDVDETGTSFTENSLLKAREVSAFCKLPALADDSGLCVDALGGDPGIYSARWSGVHGDDAENIAKVLAQLARVEEGSRGAHFTCVVALHLPNGTEIVREGILPGVIVRSPRGDAGFGYDPIFQPMNSFLTLGEFGPGEKDVISHRGQALRAIAPQLVALL